MTHTRDSYVINEIKFTEEQLKAILFGAAGVNMQLSTVRFPTANDDDKFYKAVVTERISMMFYDPNAKKDVLEESYISLNLAQLDEWNGSTNYGNAVAMRSAEIIRALLVKIEALEKAE